MAVAVLTGLLALLGWLAALEGPLSTDQPEGRELQRSLPSLIPTAPPALSPSSKGGKTKRSHSGRKAGETGSAGGGGEGQVVGAGVPVFSGESPYFSDLCHSLA